MCPFDSFAQENAEIRNIRFRGNHAFSDGELMDKITFRESSWIGKTFFKKEPSFYTSQAWEMNKTQLKAFYQSHGYLHVVIASPDIMIHSRKYKVDLTIEINEGRPVVIEDLSFETVNEGTTDSLFELPEWQKAKQSLEARPGEIFRDNQVKNDQEVIASWFTSHGYAYVGVTPDISLSADTLGASIRWLIRKGPLCRFGEISIEGAERTPLKAIRNQLSIQKGEIYSSEKLSQSQKQVYELGLFRIASVQTLLTSQKNDTVPVNIKIEEAPRLSTRLGFGYGKEDKFRTFADVGYLNFPGRTMRTNFYAKHSGLEPYRFEATITQPAVFGPSSSLKFNPGVRRRKEESFESFLWGGDLSLHQNFSDFLASSVSLYFERVDIKIASDFDRSLTELDQSVYSKNGISAGLIYNTSSPRFDPAEGWSLAFNARANSSLFNSPYPFFKYLFEIKRYQPVMSGVVLAIRLKGGSIIPMGKASVTPIEERYFAGGSQSVRGWARQMLGPLDVEDIPVGGNSLLEGSIEPRIKVMDPVSLVVFLDYGNVWRDENTFRISDLRFAAGAGLRVSTPIGPVGIDFARPVFDEVSKWQFHLNIGHAF
ncbi:MAG: outer membrane protein insertion porin family [Anaerophaga sp.]|nr:outer membrane protein insertion porin family [Anaerophaga sp.]